MFWKLLLAAALLPACGDAPPVVVVADVSYDVRFASAVMDVYMPEDGAVARPAVMLIHGGAWKFGDRSAYAGHAQRLAEAGYVAATIDYRLLPEGTYPAAMQDVLCALSALRGQFTVWGIDPDRIAVSGYSAGGHLASVIGVSWDEPDFQPDCAAGPTGPPRAVISGAGPQDLRDIADEDVVRELMGGSIAEMPERYLRASPLANVGPDAPPFLLIHGGSDWIVDADQSARMRDALRGEGVDARLLDLAGVGHLSGTGADPGRTEIGLMSIDLPEAWIATVDFLDDTLGAP